MPKFSVIIPTYNRAALAAKAIESVLAQTCTDLEIIVVDDGSTDDTAAVVGRYVSARVRYSRQENQGKSVAVNNGMRLATGELIAFLDSDDTWLPEKLECQWRAMAEHGFEHPCFTDARYINNPALDTTAFAFAQKQYDGETSLVRRPIDLFLSTRSGVYIQTLVLRADLARHIGEFDPLLRVGNDTDYLFRLALATPFTVVNRPLVEIDRTAGRADGLIEQIDRDQYLRLLEHEHLFSKWLELTRTSDRRIRRQVLGRLAETHNDWANWHLMHGHYRKARQAMQKSVATRFTAKAAAKLLLAALAPPLALREFQRRDLKRSQERVIA